LLGFLQGRLYSQEVFDVTEGEAPLESLFSKEQRAFYAANAPEEIPMSALVPLGPTFLLRFKHQPKRFDRRLTIELWLYPDGSRIFEVSTKCGTEEAFQMGVQFRALMAKCGIPLVESQETKTNSALAFFRKDLISEQAANRPAASPRPRPGARHLHGLGGRWPKPGLRSPGQVTPYASHARR
jgi:hypothetical protein